MKLSHRLVRYGLCAICMGLMASSTSAGLIGSNFAISGAGCRFPDVAFGGGRYFAVWTDYNNSRVYGRFVTNGGTVSGGVILLSESGALFPAVAYNATNNEFLVTWDDQRASPFPIWGQRVRGSDGALLGSNFQIGASEGIRSAVAWSSGSNAYMVVYWSGGASEIYGRRVGGTGGLIGGEINVSQDGVFSGYPAIAYGSNGNQFLVGWDTDTGNIYARRVDAGSGAMLGGVVVMSSGGTNDRSCIAYDSANSRWAVQFNKQIGGLSYNQWGRIINTSGGLVTGEYPIANSAGFEGDTQFGGDICYVPTLGNYFSSFGTDTGWGGQETNSGGGLVGTQIVIGTGAYTSGNNAADTSLNRFMPVWEGFVGNQWYVWGQLYEASAAVPQSPYLGSPFAIPTTIQAEHFDNGGQGVSYNDTSGGNSGGALRSTDVDIEATTDAGGGHNVGFIDTGEWLEYTINVATAGDYNIKMRVASAGSGGAYNIQLNGNNISGSRTLAGTGGWQNFTTVIVPAVFFGAGNNQVLRVSIESGGWNFNYMDISFAAADAISIDLESTNRENGMTSPIGGDGDTVGAAIGGHNCRKNMDPNFNDFYYYFTVADIYSFQGSKPTAAITFDYYDSGTGSIDLNYDGMSGAYSGGPSVALTNSNTWKTATFNVNDAYFGNRENNGADFRFWRGGAGLTYYIDTVTVVCSAGGPVTFSNTTFPSNSEGWNIVVWKAGQYSDGTMAWQSSGGNPSGNMRSAGSGGSNNTDSCTREGGEINKVISTSGRSTIQVQYDARFETNQTGTTCSGSCPVLEGNCADKLAVYYSTAGTGGPWTLLEAVNASSVSQNVWATRTLNLPAGANNQANFALRFRWQFNQSSDGGRLDNIKVIDLP